MQQEKRNRGVMLRLMNLDHLNRLALHRVNEWLEAEGSAERWTEMKPGDAPYGVSDTERGLYVICVEGVGWEVTDEKPLTIPFYGSWTAADGSGQIAITPQAEIKFTPNDVRNLADGDEIDLADLVRSFGDRLEVNFSIWWDRLGGEGRSHLV